MILLPEGKGISESRITAASDNTDALPRCDMEVGLKHQKDRQYNCLDHLQALSSTIKIKRSVAPVGGMYPLQLTVNGFFGQKKYRNHIIHIPFDVKKRIYPEPKDSPMAGADF